MAGKAAKKQNKAVSPVNGQPLPRGRQFTSETAREARRKRTEKEAAQKSITAAFMKYMGEVVVTEKDGTMLTGAQAIAKSIIRGATKGNAEMVKIALDLTGETPTKKVEIANGQMEEIINSLREPYDIHAEAAAIIGSMADESAEED